MPNQVQLCLLYALLDMEDDLRKQRDHVLAMLGGDTSRYLRQPWTDPKLAEFYTGLERKAGF